MRRQGEAITVSVSCTVILRLLNDSHFLALALRALKRPHVVAQSETFGVSPFLGSSRQAIISSANRGIMALASRSGMSSVNGVFPLRACANARGVWIGDVATCRPLRPLRCLHSQ